MLQKRKSLNSNSFSDSILSLLIEVLLVWSEFCLMILMTKGEPSRDQLLTTCCLGALTVLLYEYGVVNSCIQSLKDFYKEKEHKVKILIVIMSATLGTCVLIGNFLTTGISFIEMNPNSTPPTKIIIK
jgi:hypothetical protein